MWQKIRELLWDNPFRRWFLWVMVIIDLLGSIYGYYWYRYQLAETPASWWIFIPDSPLSTTLTGVALLLILFNKRWSTFQLLAYTAIIKYGIWAVVLISHFGLTGGYIAPEIWMLWFSHLGMAVEGFIFLRHLKVDYWQVAVVAGWMLLNDYIDYGLNFHPYFYADYQWGIAVFSAVALSLILSIYPWLKAGRNPAAPSAK